MKDPSSIINSSPLDAAQSIGNDPNPVTIAIYAIGFLIAIVWNLYAYYKLITLDYKKEEMKIKRELRAQGLLDDDED